MGTNLSSITKDTREPKMASIFQSESTNDLFISSHDCIGLVGSMHVIARVLRSIVASFKGRKHTPTSICLPLLILTSSSHIY
jgi:hypothetical protein